MPNEGKESVSLWSWVKEHKFWVFSIITSMCIIGQNLDNRWKQQATANEYQLKYDVVAQQLQKVEAEQSHDRRQDFALRLTGLRDTAQKTEQGMLEQYSDNKEMRIYIQKQGCEVPPRLMAGRPLPQYAPISALYLKEAEQLKKEQHEKEEHQ